MRPGTQVWQLSILTNSGGRVHLLAVVTGTGSESFSHVDLLAPVGTPSIAELDLEHLVVLVHGEQLAQLRRLQRCIKVGWLREQIVQLTDLAGG